VEVNGRSGRPTSGAALGPLGCVGDGPGPRNVSAPASGRGVPTDHDHVERCGSMRFQIGSNGPTRPVPPALRCRGRSPFQCGPRNGFRTGSSHTARRKVWRPVAGGRRGRSFGHTILPDRGGRPASILSARRQPTRPPPGFTNACVRIFARWLSTFKTGSAPAANLPFRGLIASGLPVARVPAGQHNPPLTFVCTRFPGGRARRSARTGLVALTVCGAQNWALRKSGVFARIWARSTGSLGAGFA